MRTGVDPDRPVAGWRRWLRVMALVTPLARWAVLVHSVPDDQPWRRACPHCAAPLLPPAGGLGALTPAGRCPGCRWRLGAPRGTVEAATVLVIAATVLAAASGWWSGWAVLALVGWAVATVPLSFIDLAVHRLPDRFTLPLAGWVVTWLGVAALASGAGEHWLRAVAGAAICGVAFLLVAVIFGSKGFGLGDVKLVVSAGALLAWLGWAALVAGLLLAFLTNGLVALALLMSGRVGRQDTLAFGPFLAVGTWGALCWVALSG